MGLNKYLSNGEMLICDKGTAPCPLKVVNPTTTIHNKQWATSGDKIVGLNFQAFGLCACKGGNPCKPKVTKWLNTAGPDINCIGNELLIHKSELPCTVGGIIKFNLSPPSDDAPPAKPSALDGLINKMNGIVSTIKAPLNMLGGAINGAIGGALGGMLGDKILGMSTNAISQAVTNKIMGEIQSKAVEKITGKKSKSGNQTQLKDNNFNPDDFLVIKN